MNPWDDPETQKWTRHVRDELIPKLEMSRLTVSLVPRTNADIKFAVELGLSIMMDKPVIALVQPGTEIPEHLARVADAIVEGGPDDPTTSERLQAAISEMLERDA